VADRCLAIVPARAGSKGVPGKNVAPVGGRPLLAWTLAAARAARGIDRLIVSTDSEEIAAVAREWGGETPFLRPAELARDETPGIEPVLHAVGWLAEHEGYRPELVLLLQPTSPLRIATDVEAALALLAAKDAEAVVSLCEVHHHPAWMKTLDLQGRVVDSQPGSEAADRRQDLPRLFALNGAIFLAWTETLLTRRSWYCDRTYGYVMPEERSLDVDTPWQLHLANLLLSEHEG
jgi:CMP-N,N'-diacetyllegionaminic acid synthase